MTPTRKFFLRHPQLSIRAAMALARLGRAQWPDVVPADWRPLTVGQRWDYGSGPDAQRIIQTRRPPMPFRRCGVDRCEFCGWPIHKGGHWRNTGPRHPMSSRHGCCTEAYLVMMGHWNGEWIAARQGWLCAETGVPLRDTVIHPWGEATYTHYEIDHVVPLWRVRLEWEEYPWPDCLRMWLPGNLQALSKAGHRVKTRREAADRARLRVSA